MLSIRVLYTTAEPRPPQNTNLEYAPLVIIVYTGKWIQFPVVFQFPVVYLFQSSDF